MKEDNWKTCTECRVCGLLKSTIESIHPTPNTPMDWEEEWEREFPNGRVYLEGKSGAYCEMPHIRKVKNFVKKLLSHQKEKLREGVEKLTEFNFTFDDKKQATKLDKADVLSLIEKI